MYYLRRQNEDEPGEDSRRRRSIGESEADRGDDRGIDAEQQAAQQPRRGLAFEARTVEDGEKNGIEGWPVPEWRSVELEAVSRRQALRRSQIVSGIGTDAYSPNGGGPERYETC